MTPRRLLYAAVCIVAIAPGTQGMRVGTSLECIVSRSDLVLIGSVAAVDSLPKPQGKDLIGQQFKASIEVRQVLKPVRGFNERKIVVLFLRNDYHEDAWFTVGDRQLLFLGPGRDGYSVVGGYTGQVDLRGDFVHQRFDPAEHEIQFRDEFIRRLEAVVKDRPNEADARKHFPKPNSAGFQNVRQLTTIGKFRFGSMAEDGESWQRFSKVHKAEMESGLLATSGIVEMRLGRARPVADPTANAQPARRWYDKQYRLWVMIGMRNESAPESKDLYSLRVTSDSLCGSTPLSESRGPYATQEGLCIGDAVDKAVRLYGQGRRFDDKIVYLNDDIEGGACIYHRNGRIYAIEIFSLVSWFLPPALFN